MKPFTFGRNVMTLFALFVLALLSACVPQEDSGTSQVQFGTQISKACLVSTKWGPEKSSFGLWLTFYDDGTFKENFAGETGDPPFYGSYTFKNDTITIVYKKAGDIPIDESGFKLPSKIRHLSLRETDESLYLTRYLIDASGDRKFWDMNSRIPAGERRVVKDEAHEISIVIVESPLRAKNNAMFREKPSHTARRYEICETGCGEEATVMQNAELLDGLLGRTETKEMVNGVEDYWYVADVFLPWYSEVRLVDENGAVSSLQQLDASNFWIHGSDLYE